MLRMSILAGLCCAAVTVATGAAFAADPAEGKATYEQRCASCHEMADWKAKSVQDITDGVLGVATGKTTHKKPVKLTDAQAADVAAYLVSTK
ncbi:MAG: cytochrome c [Telmatospirillum sp.]|nr:cytochrome c [Telmatospirillum sp.]